MGEKIIEEAKKVNLTELFYDLVFVFGISKITHILESLNEFKRDYHLYRCFCLFHQCMECADRVYEPLWKT